MNRTTITESPGDDGYPQAIAYRTPSQSLALEIAAVAEEKGLSSWSGLDNVNYSSPIRLFRAEVFEVSRSEYTDIVVAAIERHSR